MSHSTRLWDFFLYTYLGYHGTSREAAESIVSTGKFDVSPGDACFLGTGAYFFEAGPRHALSWADRKRELEGCEIAVVEAIIKAEVVLNLCDRKHWDTVRMVYDQMSSHGMLPQQLGPDGLFSETSRNSDSFGHNYCDHTIMNKVIEITNETLKDVKQEVEVVRCPFVRGSQLFPNSWYFRGACITLSVTRTDCIKRLRVVD